MDPDFRDECHDLARAALHAVPDRCGATPTGYDVQVYCERETGHPGRHWSDRLNWPA